MKWSGKPPVPSDVRRRFWQLKRAGLGTDEAAAAVGRSSGWAHQLVRDAGGVNPVPVAELAGRYLSFEEREELMRLRAAGMGVRAIARELGRDPATVSRELKRGNAYRKGYKASVGVESPIVV